MLQGKQCRCKLQTVMLPRSNVLVEEGKWKEKQDLLKKKEAALSRTTYTP